MKKGLLLLFVLAAALVNAQGPLSPSRSNVDLALAPFFHGVASGDPLTDRVIIWTRITTENATETVGWEIATDTTFASLVNSGSVTTDSSSDFTVKVDVTGLQENTWYYYRFSNNGVYSIKGRTRTMPAGNVANLRFAVVACSNYQDGFFNVYNDIAKKNDVDAVIHLGDYYYEYGPDDFTPGVDSSRLQEPYKEIWTKADYRQRHSFYKLDPDLRTIHQQYPFFTVWDDHESANDSWNGGAQNHTDSVEGYWPDRKEDSRTTYFEWMPIRNVHNSVDTIHRVIPMGNLADLIMLDSRLEGREIQAGTTGATVTDTNRTMLGSPQLEWYKQQLSASNAKWKLIGNQVMFAPLVVPILGALNQDQWDGYPAERNKILRHISSNNIDNVVILTGDIHTSWANDVPHPDMSYNSSTGAGSAAVEFVCTSVTSGSFITFSIPASLIPSVITHVKYADLAKRGYLLFDVTSQKVQGDWVYMNTIESRTYTSSVGASWCDLDGANHLTQCGSPLAPRGTNPGLAPLVTDVRLVKPEEMTMLSLYPNPSVNEVAIQFYLFKPATVSIIVTDINGRMVHNQQAQYGQPGLYNAEADLSNLAAGTYLLSIATGSKVVSKKIVKTN
ncbi:MAG TPA: alkaline phosphatase D family protein [Chitinophagales bacterium]|nr:alkaline phosphatase D family protein [Chitinophagales bacterium]